GADKNKIADIGGRDYNYRDYQALRAAFRSKIADVKTIVTTMRRRGPRAADKTGPESFSGQWRVVRVGNSMADYAAQDSFPAELVDDLKLATLASNPMALNNTM